MIEECSSLKDMQSKWGNSSKGFSLFLRLCALPWDNSNTCSKVQILIINTKMKTQNQMIKKMQQQPLKPYKWQLSQQKVLAKRYI